MPHIQPVNSLFVSWQSAHNWMFSLVYNKLNIWPCKLKAKVLAKVKIDGHIWGLVFDW